MIDPQTQARIDALESRLQQMQAELMHLRYLQPQIDHPYREVFIATLTGEETWQERSVVSNAFVDMTNGRVGDATDQYFVRREAGEHIVLAVRDGDLYRYVDITGDLFLVKVQKTGGSDGTSTTAATWTYTVRSVDEVNTLGTAITVARPRPNGKMTAQSGSSGFGLAFYDGVTLKLWDAGEKPGTAECP